jgi:hypothetical protein
MNQQEAEKIAESLAFFDDNRTCDADSVFCEHWLAHASAALLSIATAEYARGVEDAAKIADEYARKDHPDAVTVTDLAASAIRELLDHPQSERPPLPSIPIETIKELRRYVIKRGNENRERERGAFGSKASWFSAKAATYQRIESKLDDILATVAPPSAAEDEQRFRA